MPINKHTHDELVCYNNALREAEAKLNKLCKRQPANRQEIKRLKEEVDRLYDIVKSLCQKEYDELIPDHPIETVTITSISDFVKTVT